MLTSISRKKSHFIFLLAATLFPQYNVLAKCKETNVKNIYMSINSDKYLRIAYGIDTTNAEKELVLYKDLYQVPTKKGDQPKLLQKNIEINALAEKVCLKEGETTVSAVGATHTATAAAATPTVGAAVSEAVARAEESTPTKEEAAAASRNGTPLVSSIGVTGAGTGAAVNEAITRANQTIAQENEARLKKAGSTEPSSTGETVDPGISAGDIAREDAKFARQAEAAKSGDGLPVGDVKTDKTVTDPAKLPSDADVSKASFTLQNAATALQGANDIVGGMKAGGLKGFAQAATGAINIAQMLDPIDAKAMAASAEAFNKQVEVFVANVNKVTGAVGSIAAANKLAASTKAYMAAVTKCTAQLSTSKGVCNEFKNGNAMAVTQLMTAGAGLIQNLSSASETCGTTADLTKVAGLGMAGVGMMCSQNMTVCKSDCGQTGVTLKAVVADIATVKSTMSSEQVNHMALCDSMVASSCTISSGLFALEAQVTTVQASAQKEEGTTVGSTTLACAGLGLQVLNFANQVSDLIKSSNDADKCKKALTAGNGSGGGSAITNITTEEMCKNSANASMQVCKCHKDATAEGCPGAIAKALSKDPGGLTIKGGSGVSQLAGFGSKSSGSAGTNNSGGGLSGESSGLSEAAKQALGLNTGNPNATAANSASGVSGTNGTAGSGSESGNKNEAENLKAKKFDFGSFGSIGSGISNFFGGKGKKSGSNAAITDKQIEKAKRQIASAQLRNEVSTASGKSNWDKIRARYVENRGSFMGD